MSVRRRKYRDPQTGAQHEAWMVDVDFTYPNGRTKRVRRISPVQTRRGAEQYERDLRQAMLSGEFDKKEEQAPTLAEFAEDFFETYARANNKPSEVENKRQFLTNQLVPFFGASRLDAISEAQIEKFKAAKLKESYAPKSVNNFLTVLGTMLRIAQEWGRIERIPRILKLRVPEAPTKFLSPEETARLLAAAKDEPQWHSAIVVAINTGLRVGELLALRWEDLDLAGGSLRVRRTNWRGQLGTPKGWRSRMVPLNRRARAALEAQRHKRGELVWCKRDGSTWTKDNFDSALKRIRKRAGLWHFKWHVLRHTFASHLVMQGVPLKAVQELLGHTDIRLTMRYAHLASTATRSAVSVLDELPYGTLAALSGAAGATAASEE